MFLFLDVQFNIDISLLIGGTTYKIIKFKCSVLSLSS